jgi:hypothetical protein
MRHEHSVTSEQCGKSFFRKARLRPHRAKYNAAGKYKCEICGFEYSFGLQPTSLYVHMRQGLCAKSFDYIPDTLSVCQQSFSQRSTLIHH